MKGKVIIGFILTVISCLGMMGMNLPSTDNGENPDEKNEINITNLISSLDYSLIFQNIEFFSEDQIFELIDSLFEADSVPINLITELSLYLDFHYSNPVNNLHNTYMEGSPYPAHSFYKSWNIELTNPYKNDICLNDSSFIMTLKDEGFDCDYHHPFPGPITSNFGWRDGKQHAGIDIDLVTGDSVVAAFSGMVRISRRHGGYGNVVVIRHYNGLETTYAHLSKLKVNVGDVVDPGQLIGLGGNTGHSSGSHLHFEVRFKGKAFNPKNIINFKQHAILSDSITIKKTQYGYAVYPVGQEFHVVKRGDFLFKIANQYGTSVNNLCSWNGIRRNSTLRVGQHIRIEPLASK
jgi:murein DD-endopeptidase MepM/ murein hydrolase activator NlpD